MVSCATLVGIENAEIDPALRDGGSDDAGDTGPCGSYCDAVMANCSGVDAVYTSHSLCMKACALFDPADAGDPSGNTLVCRTRNAELAGEIEPGVHCPAAGPGGDGVCGDNCDGYCTMMLATCSLRFQDLADCLVQCETVPDLGGYNVMQQSGDSVQCRLYHVSAATLDAEQHCGHAAGETPCN
jgi:hypothetical protein